MNSLQTDNLIALSLLINEDIYLSPADKIEITAAQIIPEQQIEQVVEKPIEQTKVAEIAEKVVVPAIPPSISTVIPILAQPEKQDFKYLGDNNKYVLVVVNEPNAEFLKKEDLAFLLKIMGAKKWELSDIAIINKAKYTALDFQELKDFFGFNKVVTFGINPKDLNIVGALANKKSEFKNVFILGTWDLPKLQQDVAKKTIFWNELKTF